MPTNAANLGWGCRSMSWASSFVGDKSLPSQLSPTGHSVLLEENSVVVCPNCSRPWSVNIRDVTPHSCCVDASEDTITILSKHSSSTMSKLTKTKGAQIHKRQRKNALDLDRHCGVIIAPSGVPCMRSVTCKSHSLASKRAVIGRSKNFDTLLAEYIVANPSRSNHSVKNSDAAQQRHRELELSIGKFGISPPPLCTTDQCYLPAFKDVATGKCQTLDLGASQAVFFV